MRKIIMLVLLLGADRPAAADTTTQKLSRLSEKLISDYQGKKGAQNTTLAAFPFNTDDKLAKKRIGFAVVETMSHKFVSNGLFTVVERAELNKLLAEQKLSASGVIENETAIKLGQVLGAQVLLLGNVQKAGKNYQINARLVDVRSSEVVSSGYEELAASAFEEEAGGLVAYVPEAQVLGVYLLYNYRHNGNELPRSDYTSGNIGTLYLAPIKDDPKAFSLGAVGAGIRYRPAQRLVVDLAYMETTAKVKAGSWQYLWGFPGDWYPDVYYIKTRAYRALVNWKVKLSDGLAWYPGVGVTAYSISYSAHCKYLTPTLSSRLEYSIQSRIGVSFAAGYDLENRAARGRRSYLGGATASKRAILDKLYFEPSISIYF